MAILDENTLDFISSSPEQTVRLGVRLGELLEPGDCVCLMGELGAGKTAMAQGIGRGWGAGRRVTSPTFSLVNEYPRFRDGRILYHVDCYRLHSEGEVVTAGLEDILNGNHTTMIEWPERIETRLPPGRLSVELRTINDTRRGVRMKASGQRPAELLKQFRQSAFGV
ncbi:MAG: tRNA (adenosine(37)-N6)-threonylcarbamoyltransferase complex ATPase subunit type 1 TsaE [Candidatus Promineifilaceae bacterium]